MLRKSLNLPSSKYFSRLGLIAFVLVFATIGVGLKNSSHAAAGPTGDLNSDGTVNVFDLSIFLSHWQQSGTGITGDLNSDNTVNIFDLSVLLSNWGQTAGGGPAPSNTTQPYFTASTVDSSGTCSAGCAIQGQQLSVTPGAWSNNPTSYSYQWQDCITTPGTSTGTLAYPSHGLNGYIMTLPATGSCSNASGPGATSSTYTVGASDVGKALAVRVTANNSGGSTSTSASGTCNTGLMTTAMPNQSNPSGPPASTYFDNGQPGCSPISAVVGTGQYGTSTSGEHFCSNAPTTCGFGDIGNTGPPAGTTLYAVPGTCTSPAGPGAGCSNTGSGWSYSGGSIHLTNGTTLKNVSYSGCMSASGLSNVTIEDSNLTCHGTNSWVIATSGSSNITILNNNISGQDAAAVGAGMDSAVRDTGCNSTNITIANNNMWFGAADLNNICGNGGWATTGNYIHDFAYSVSGNHFDGIQTEGGGSSSSAFLFANNTVIMDMPQTAPIILSNDNNLANTYRTITHNLLAGGGYSLYVAGTTTYPTTNSTFSNNVFTSIYFGSGSSGSSDLAGGQAPDGYWTASTNTWSNNIWDDNGLAAGP